jgi:hypothetical protein
MLLTAATLTQQKAATISDDELDWLGKVRQRAYDALLPVDLPGLRAAFRTDEWHDLSQIERYFEINIGSAPSRPLEATVVIPVGGSIGKQLLDIHARDVKASFEAILVQVSVRRVKLDSTTCPAIESRMRVLQELDVSLADDNMIRLDHAINQIVIWNASGRFDAKLEDEKHALVSWADDTHSALLACEKSGR